MKVGREARIEAEVGVIHLEDEERDSEQRKAGALQKLEKARKQLQK